MDRLPSIASVSTGPGNNLTNICAGNETYRTDIYPAGGGVGMPMLISDYPEIAPLDAPFFLAAGSMHPGTHVGLLSLALRYL
jgi:hypothetical protein